MSQGFDFHSLHVGCVGKLAHRSYSEATHRIVSQNKKGGRGRRMKAYQCSNCGFWHVGGS